MKEILSFVFDKITDPLTLPIHLLYEWLILGAIGLLAYILAFRAVGYMYDTGEISGSLLGKLFHWIIRAFFFVAIWAITYTAIVVVQWVKTHVVLLLCIVGGLVVLGVSVFFGVRYLEKRRALHEKEAA